MIFSKGNAERTSQDLSHRRLMFGLLISLSLHGILLSLHFGLAGLGLPDLELPWRKRSAELPPLQIVLAAPPEVASTTSPAASNTNSPRASSVSVPSGGLILLAPPVPSPVTTTKIETPPAPMPSQIKRAKRKQPLITQDKNSEDGFLVPAASEEIAQAKTDNESENETGDELDSALAQAEQAALEKAKLEQIAAAAAAEQLAQREALQKAEAKRAADILRLQAEQAEQAKAEQVLQEQAKLAKEQAERLQEQDARAKLQEEATKLAQRNAEIQQLAALKQAQAERERAQQEHERELQERVLKEQQIKEQQIKEQQLKELAAKQLREQQAAEELQRQKQELAEQALKRAAEQAKAAEQARLAEKAKAAEQARLADQADAKARADAAKNTAVAQNTNSKLSGNPHSNPNNQGNASDGKPVPFVLPKNISGSSLLDTAKSQLKNFDLSRPPRAAEKDTNSARRSVFGSTLQDVPVRMYVEAWQQKIERNGRMNYSQLSSNKARGDPLVNVIIRSDGSVEEVLIMRSSGRADIDEAVRRIVHLNAPYAAFPKNIAAKYDQIEIRRVWGFDEGLKLLEELR